MTMPKGKYFIGDLCYVMHAEWDEFCKLTIDEHDCKDGEFALADGRKFATYGTAYGDGLYTSNVGTKHPVDAGLIGCIRVEDIREPIDESSGAIIEFDRVFRTGRSKDGTIYFGHVSIPTGNEESEDENDDDTD